MSRPKLIAKRVLQVTALAVVLLSAGNAVQFPVIRPGADPPAPLGAGHGPEDESPFGGRREMLAHQLKLLHDQHQKEVVADSARLVQLAAELKAETDQGATASPDALKGELKDVDQIARLARKLSDRIKNE